MIKISLKKLKYPILIRLEIKINVKFADFQFWIELLKFEKKTFLKESFQILKLFSKTPFIV